MTTGAKLAIAAGIYGTIGSVVAVWTVARNHSGKPSFAGLGTNPTPATILAECMLLWPVAIYKNLAPGSAEKTQAIATASSAPVDGRTISKAQADAIWKARNG